MKLDIFCSKRNKKTFVSKIALIIAMVAIMGVTAQAEILMDYDDDEVNGVHDVAVRDGDFSNTTVAEGVDSALYSETPNWTDITEWDYQQNEEATRTNRASGVGSDRNAVLRTDPVAAQSLDYVLTAGEIDYNISYMWNDVYVWDPNCTVSVFLYTTHNDSIRGDQTDVVTCESRKSEVVLDYQTETFSGTITIPEASVGKNLFVRFESVNQTAGLARLDNLFIEVISAVELVAPANGEIEIPYDGTQLQWIVKNDWACDVNFGTDPGALALELAGYEGVGGVYAYDKDALDPNTTYYWSIDAIDPNDNLTDPSDDVRIPGPVWSFKTDHLAAIIDSDPDGLLIYPGEDAAYSVVAHNPTTGDTTGLTYQWYKYVDGVSDVELSDGADHSGTATTEMTILAADLADEGAYYCSVTLDPKSVQSHTTLGIKSLKAHWTMDQANYVGGLYLDSSGNAHDADPTGDLAPAFALGADGTTATGAVTIGPATGWAEAGTWNPSEYSNCLTISTWVNWNGPNEDGSSSGIAAKRDAWGTDNGMWQLTLTETGGLWLASGAASAHTVGAEIPTGEWHYICATVDSDNMGAIYVDGEMLETFEFSLGTKTDSPVVIGILDTDPFLRSFNGLLDDVRIYNYALTQDEIVDEYFATSNTAACVNRPAMDITGPGPEGRPDCLFNIYDFAYMAENWLDCGFEPLAACPE